MSIWDTSNNDNNDNNDQYQNNTGKINTTDACNNGMHEIITYVFTKTHFAAVTGSNHGLMTAQQAENSIGAFKIKPTDNVSG